MFVKFSPNAGLLNALSVWATLISCVCLYLMYLMHRSLFQLLFSVLLMAFWNAVIQGRKGVRKGEGWG